MSFMCNKMGHQGWMGLILLSFVWSISLRQVEAKRVLLQTPPSPSSPWLRFPDLLPPMGQPNIPKSNFTLPPSSLPQPSPLPSLPPRPQLIPRMPGSLPPSSLPTFPWNVPSPPPLPTFPWNTPSPPLPTFPWNTPSPLLPTFPWSIPPPPTFSWGTSPPPTFPWINPTNPLPTIPSIPFLTLSPPPPNGQVPNGQSFPWSTQSPPPPSGLSFPWNMQSPPPPSFPWSTSSPPPPSFPWITSSPPPPSFPWSTSSPPPPFLNLPWTKSPPPSLPPWLQKSTPPPFLLPWLTPSPPTTWYSSPLPPFGLPPGSPLFPTGIQFTFSNFTESWFPEAGIKVTWVSTISLEMSIKLLVQAIMKPITLIVTAIQDAQKMGVGGGWQLKSGLVDSKLGTICTSSGDDGSPLKNIVLSRTPIDDTITTAITWFTILFDGGVSKDSPPKATLDTTPGSFGGFVTNNTIADLKIFCNHPGSLNRIAAKQGLYVLT